MKTIKILLASLLLASSAFALGKNERNALLGFGAGIIVSHIINQHHGDRGNFDLHASFGQTFVEPVRHVVHEQPRYMKKHHHTKKHSHVKRNHMKKHHRHGGHYAKHHHKKRHHKHMKRDHHRDNMVVVNNHRSRHYY